MISIFHKNYPESLIIISPPINLALLIVKSTIRVRYSKNKGMYSQLA